MQTIDVKMARRAAIPLGGSGALHNYSPSASETIDGMEEKNISPFDIVFVVFEFCEWSREQMSKA